MLCWLGRHDTVGDGEGMAQDGEASSASGTWAWYEFPGDTRIMVDLRGIRCKLPEYRGDLYPTRRCHIRGYLLLIRGLYKTD